MYAYLCQIKNISNCFLKFYQYACVLLCIFLLYLYPFQTIKLDRKNEQLPCCVVKIKHLHLICVSNVSQKKHFIVFILLCVCQPLLCNNSNLSKCNHYLLLLLLPPPPPLLPPPPPPLPQPVPPPLSPPILPPPPRRAEPEVLCRQESRK